MFAGITEASIAYSGAGGSCASELAAQREEIESGNRNVGLLREVTQRMARYFCSVAKGVDTDESIGKLRKVTQHFKTSLPWLISGYTPKELPVPIDALVLDRSVDITGIWSV